MNLGIIGTSVISKEFANAAQQTGLYNLTSVFSRKEDTGRAFATSYKAMAVYTDYSSFITSPKVDIVYVASPNSLHYEQVMQAIEAGKHVIVEKPAFLSGKQAKFAYELAGRKNVLLFEAIRHIHEKNFITLADIVKNTDEIKGASLNMMGYSSRYDAVLEGKEPNIFSLKYGGGALYDLGIYVTYSAVSLFGKPSSAFYYCTAVQTGVDGMGVLIFRYNEFDVVMRIGKTANSYLASEIYLGSSTIEIDTVSYIGSIKIHDNQSSEWRQIADNRAEHPLTEELVEFHRIINNIGNDNVRAKYEYLKDLCCLVHDTLESLRLFAGINFILS